MSMNTLFAQNRLLMHLCLFLGAILLIFAGYIIPGETTQSLVINLATEFLSVVVLFFLFDQVIEKKKARHANEKIHIVLKEHGKSGGFRFPVPLRRSEFSRQEVLGVIGMIPMKKEGARFSLKHRSDPEFLDNVNKIAEGEGEDTIYIRCTAEELEQFDFPEDWAVR